MNPVVFCILNREDELAISFFLSSVRSFTPETKVTIMTDNDNAVSQLRHFLCTCHIQRSWIKNIHCHFREDALRTESYCHLCAMLQAKSENDYLKYQDAFEFKFQSINPGFLSYLADRHVSRPEKWSSCFRKVTEYANVNTNMFVESFHNLLKTIFFPRKA